MILTGLLLCIRLLTERFRQTIHHFIFYWIQIVYGDITNDNDINKISHNKDIVIHLAAIIPPLADENPDLTYQVNTIGSEKLIRSLEKYSLNAFFIYSSSIAIYGDRLKNSLININDELKPSNGDKYAITKILVWASLKATPTLSTGWIFCFNTTG